MTTTIDQSEDFLPLEIDGQRIDVDLYAARDAMAKVDRKHRDDVWTCFDCRGTFVRDPKDVSANCVYCESSAVTRDESWLDSVAAYVKSLGAARCSRNTAGMFYTLVVNRIEEIKKKLQSMPESPTTSDSTPAGGEADASEPLLST